MPVVDAVFVGKIYLPEIWGGPIVPPGQLPSPPGLGLHPEHPIYYPPYPAHPIYLPPSGGAPVPPLGIWGGASEPFPTPPIYLPVPRPPVDAPNPPAGGGAKPPPPEGGWGYHPDYGWGYFPPGGKPQPGKR